MSLSINKIFTIGFVLIVFTIIAAGVVTRIEVFDSFTVKQQHDLTSHTQNVSKIIALELKNKTTLALNFIDSIGLKAHFENIPRDELIEQSQLIQNFIPELIGFAIFDGNGDILGDPKIQKVMTICQRDIKLLTQAKKNNSFPVIHKQQTPDHFDIYIPFNTEFATYTLFFSFSLKFLNAALEPFYNENYSYLLSDKGQTLFSHGTQGLAFHTKSIIPQTQWILSVEAPSSNIEDTLKYPKLFFIFVFFFLIISGFILKRVISFYFESDFKALLLTINDIDKDREVRKIETSLDDFNQLNNSVYQQAVRLQNSQKSLEKLIRLDPLTQLANRRALESDAKKYHSFAERGTPVSIVLMDLNSFKLVNDHLGHQTGDQLLIAMADFFTLHIRNSDQIYRLGGDEFLAVLTNTDETQAEQWKANIMKQVDTVLDQFPGLAALQSEVGISAGIATYTGKNNIEYLINLADKAMYKEKHKLKKQDR